MSEYRDGDLFFTFTQNGDLHSASQEAEGEDIAQW